MEEVFKESIKTSVYQSGQPETVGNRLVKYIELSAQGGMSEEEKDKLIDLILDSTTISSE
jgi:hypothetical protein